jgi:adenylate cyclase class 2
MEKQEIEVKFFIQDIKALEKRLNALRAGLVNPRVREINLRFDNPDGDLKRQHQVLRLRHDFDSYLTFKGATLEGQEVSMRHEIELKVSDFDAARNLLEALGFIVVMMYEKYRTSYRIDETIVVLDKMPYGNFAEIEGGDVASIASLAKKLGLNWETRCLDSYLMLFDKVCKRRGIHPKQLSFAEFEGMTFRAEDFGLKPADM